MFSVALKLRGSRRCDYKLFYYNICKNAQKRNNSRLNRSGKWPERGNHG